MSDKGITHYVGDDCEGGHYQDTAIAILERKLATAEEKYQEAKRKLDAVRSHTGEAAVVLKTIAERAGMDVLGYDLYERALSSANTLSTTS
ncbi:hypothetical protein LCGC14_1614150 [marine sediment metagenome]|uniref:Uncharacterized protein n=1 Tax=marine sediment metagenome TaxID=412755 RepID=A0A0F9L7L7_9ZZZZ